MKQNIIRIEVAPTLPDSPTAADGGTMFEHNASALCFSLDAAYIAPDYRYYLEFITVKGIMRTEYLMPNEQREILFALPLEITSQMAAKACLNIVKMNTDGVTEQLIKAATVQLYFSPLQNTEKQLDANYAFSVNALLEAIKNGTFKGDNYILTQEDKNDIIKGITKNHFGLPLYHRTMGSKKIALPYAAEEAIIGRLEVSSNHPEKPLNEVKLCFGKNLLDAYICKEGYNRLTKEKPDIGTFLAYLKENRAYELTRLNKQNDRNLHSKLTYNNQEYWFCHPTDPSRNCDTVQILTQKAGRAEFWSDRIGASQSAYDAVLENEWQGLTLMDKGKTLTLRKTFTKPLYYLSEQNKDSYDLVSGERTVYIEQMTVKRSNVSPDPMYLFHLQSGDLYCYQIVIPEEGVGHAIDSTDGWCSHYPTMRAEWLPTSEEEMEAYIAKGNAAECAFFGDFDYASLYIFSRLAPADFLNFLDAEEQKGTPIQFLYVREYPITIQEGTKMEVQLPANSPDLYISPMTATADISYAANVTKKANDLESRISALENRMVQ